MSKLEELERYESDIESKEEEAENAENEFKEACERLSNIESAIGNLSDDKEVSESLESNKTEAEQEKSEAEQKKEQIVQELEEIDRSLEEMNTENENSASVLAEIEQAGEDVSDAKSIVDSRRDSIKIQKEKVNGMLQKLRQ